MKKYLNKRNIYIALFALLYILCSVCSLIHSFAFFGLANNLPMSIMLGTCFELGQFAVLMSLLTSKRNQGKIMQYVLLITLTVVQILGNVFSSFKYLMLNSVTDLEFFKKPIFIWTDLPDDITTVIVTWIIGAILPCVCLLLTSMVSNYIMDDDPNDNKELIEDDKNDLLKIKTEQIENDSKQLDSTEIERKSINDNNESINKESKVETDNHEQEENGPEIDEETKQVSDNKEDDEIDETDDASNERVQENVKETNEDGTKEMNQKTKSHFLNI